MYEAFLTFIKAQNLPVEQSKVLLAVSGGVDSMVLADLFARAGFDFAVAHVNYGLRGEDSQKDEELVKGWCSAHNIQLHVRHVSEMEYDVQASLQMVARKIRYAFFEQLQQAHGYEAVATAHNQNDNLETVLLNLTKGTGIRGLTGIAPNKEGMIRPLLFATKEELYAYASERNLTWREDKSNKKNDYQRNLIRNEVIPLLKQINPNLEQTFAKSLERIVGAAEIVAEEAGKWSVNNELGVITVPLQGFTDSLSSRVKLSELLRDYGYSYADVSDLHASILSQQSGKLFFSDSHVVNLDRNQLLIKPKKDSRSVRFHIATATEENTYGNLRFKLTTVPGNTLPMHIPAHVGYFDLAKVKFPLEVTTWEPGDVFQPLGMKGKKKVSDFMIDSKIPVTLKQDVLTMKSAREIIWLVGYRSDDRYKVTTNTTTMLRIEVIPHA